MTRALMGNDVFVGCLRAVQLWRGDGGVPEVLGADVL